MPGLGDCDDVLAGAIESQDDGSVMRLPDLPQLIASMRATGRPKDREQPPELEALLQRRRKAR